MNQKDLDKLREKLFADLESKSDEEIQNRIDEYMERTFDSRNYNRQLCNYISEENAQIANSILNRNDSDITSNNEENGRTR